MRRWLLLGLSMAGVVLCCMLLWTLLWPSQHATSAAQNPGASPDLPTLSTEAAVRKATAILEAGTASELVPLIRPGSLGPEKLLALLGDFSAEHGRAEPPRWIGSVDTLTLPSEAVLVRYKDGEPRLLCFTPDENGEWLADMDAYAQLCDPPFREFAEGNADSGLVRIVASRDTYFNGLYTDEDEWACFALRATRKDAVIYGYCRHGSDQMAAMLAIEGKTTSAADPTNSNSAPRSATQSRLTLRIKHDPKAAIKQFEITDVLSDTWLIPDVPLDEALRLQMLEP